MRIYITIVYIYENYIYQGIIRKIHGGRYAKEHALSVFVFLLLCNVNSIIKLLKIDWIIELNVMSKFLFAMFFYAVIRWLLINKQYLYTPTPIMIFLTILYACISIVSLCLSFVNW